MKSVFLIAIMLLPAFTFAQNADCFEKKDFVIVAATEDYAKALKIIEEVNVNYGIPINLRNMIPDKRFPFQLTMPIEDCLQDNGDSTCYYPRGREDDSTYLSAEPASDYDGLNRNFYLVVCAHGQRTNKQLPPLLTKIKRKYPAAYIKTSKVYICCMH